MINGINLSDMVQNQVTFQPGINTVAEFKIDNSTYSAEYVTRSLGIMIGYFGNKGTHLEIDRNVNQSLVPGNALSRPFLALSASSPFLPGVTLSNGITERDSSSNSNYHSLWITATQRVSHGLQFNGSYTWSHSIDDVSRNNQLPFVQDSNNIGGSRGSSDFDVRHRFVANAIYDLPFTRNRLVSGWQLAPIVSVQTGNPFTIVLASSAITGEANTVRPNVNGPVQVSGNPFGQWIVNPSAVFSTPAPGTFGNLGRNTVYGPGFADVDLALIKNTKLTERMNLQFRLDAFDLFNHPNFGQPGPLAANGASIITISPANVVPNTFSTVASTRFPTADSGSSRQLQWALKLRF